MHYIKRYLLILIYIDLTEKIKEFENLEKEYAKLEMHGLPTTANKDALIAVLINDYERKTHYHEFSKINFEYQSYNKSQYDIPFYYSHHLDGYAIFSTYSEMRKIEQYLSKQKDVKRTRRISFEDEPIESEPEPKKEHSYCQLCYQDYDNYKAHLVSAIHLENIAKHSEKYKLIASSLKRIRLFWLKTENEMKSIENRSSLSRITTNNTKDKETIFEETKVVPDLQKTEEYKPIVYQLIIKKDRKDNDCIMSDISTQATIKGTKKKEYVLCKIEKRKLNQLMMNNCFNVHDRRPMFKTNEYFIPQYNHKK